MSDILNATGVLLNAIERVCEGCTAEYQLAEICFKCELWKLRRQLVDIKIRADVELKEAEIFKTKEIDVLYILSGYDKDHPAIAIEE